MKRYVEVEEHQYTSCLPTYTLSELIEKENPNLREEIIDILKILFMHGSASEGYPESEKISTEEALDAILALLKGEK